MDQLTFATFGRFYTSEQSNQRFVKLGVFGKTTLGLGLNRICVRSS